MITKSQRAIGVATLFLFVLNIVVVAFLFPMTGLLLWVFWFLILLSALLDFLVVLWSLGVLPDEGITKEKNVETYWNLGQIVQMGVIVLGISFHRGLISFFVLVGLATWMCIRNANKEKLMNMIW